MEWLVETKRFHQSWKTSKREATSDGGPRFLNGIPRMEIVSICMPFVRRTYPSFRNCISANVVPAAENSGSWWWRPIMGAPELGPERLGRVQSGAQDGKYSEFISCCLTQIISSFLEVEIIWRAVWV